VFLDADVVAFERPEAAFLDTVLSADFVGQLDYQGNLGWDFKGMSNASTICAGIFFIRSSAKSLKWMDLVIKSFSNSDESKLEEQKKYGRWDDQIGLNYLLHDPKQSIILNPSLDHQPIQTDIGEGTNGRCLCASRQGVGGHYAGENSNLRKGV